METRIESYKLTHMDKWMQGFPSYSMQIAEQVKQGVEEADSFKQECAEMNKKVETVLRLLPQAARVYCRANRPGLYERPIRCIMVQVATALDRALVLVRKCKRIGILIKMIINSTYTTDFEKVSVLLLDSIADIEWLLNISEIGEDRSGLPVLPPIASTDPVLGEVWEQVSIVQFGTPVQKAEAADYLGTRAKGSERYAKTIVEEEGVPPLLRLLIEGTVSGQEAAARALGQLGRYEKCKRTMICDVPTVFIHVLSNHATSTKVQIEVARAISQFALEDKSAQYLLASLGAIRLLVRFLAHDLIEDTLLRVASNKSTIFDYIVKSLGEKIVSASGACEGQASTQDLSQAGNNLDADLQPAATGLELGSVLTHGRWSTTDHQSRRQTSVLYQGNLNHQDKEDLEIKLVLWGEATHALWKLVADNVKNIKLITDTCALLCFSKLIETGHRRLKYYSIMAIMEITAAAEKDREFRMTAFRITSKEVEAVVECLVQVLEVEADKPDLQAPCATALGNLAKIFPAPARAQIAALTTALGSEDITVATEGAIALSKFADKGNYVHSQHLKTMLELGTIDHLVQLMSFRGVHAYGKLNIKQLLHFLSLQSDDAPDGMLPVLLTDSFVDLGMVPSEVSEQVPSTLRSSNQLALQEISSMYLDRVIKVVRNLDSLQTSNAFQINHLQCQYLCGKLLKSLDDAHVYIHDLILQDGNPSSTQNILKKLLQTAKDVEKLVKDCSRNQLIQAAITLADSKEHFVSLAFNVELYMALLQNSLNEETRKMFLIKLKDWSNEVSIQELQIVDERANRDHLHLLSTLRAQVGSGNQMANLMQRLETIRQSGSLGLQNGAHVKAMWREEQKNLQRVQNLAFQNYSSVYEIVWLGEHFAEKCFPVQENESFKREASILAGLAHPNIVPSFCSATSDRSCSIVMELMDKSLYHLMEGNPLDGPFEPLAAIDIMLQIAEGMRYLHQNRVIHRDLKSMNILVKCDEQVYAKVADFGLSKFKESSCTYSNQTSNQGTTRWMAPELFDSAENQNHGESAKSLQYPFKVDVYSFGMVCYEVLTGRTPFYKISSMREIRKVVKDGERPIIPDECPEKLSTLIQACYHPNPAARPSFPDICGELRQIMCSLVLESAF